MSEQFGSSKLTGAGRAWCTAALDPFHDYVQSVSGLPDGTNSPSFTRVHTQVLSIGATANGDTLLVSFNGFHETVLNAHAIQNMVDGSVFANCTASFAAATGPISVLRCAKGATGTFDSCGLPYLASGLNTLVGTLALTPDIQTPSRIIGLGLEVHDTTAPINRQGSISINHVPGSFIQDAGRNAYIQTLAGNGNVAIKACQGPALPNCRDHAALLPGFVEWEAAKGAYVTGRLVTPQMPRCLQVVQGGTNASYSSCQNHGIITQGYIMNGSESWAVPFLVGGVATPQAFATSAYPSFWSGFQPFQIWITGVAATSTFKLVLRTIVEYFPESSDLALLPNAIAPVPMDSEALLEYHRARSVLPAAVPVALNAKGDWWRMVRRALAVGTRVAGAAIPALLNAAGQPVLGSIAQVGLPAVASILEPRPQSRQRQKRPNPPRGGKVKKNK